MHCIGISQYGPIDNLESRESPNPPSPKGRQLCVRTQAVSVNPIDIKVRQGSYDDPPDYYERVKALTQENPEFHIVGYDGAGVVEAVGPEVKYFKPGDEIYYLGSPVLQGTYAEQQILDERHAGHKPKSLDFVQSAAMPLTYGTAYESLVSRLEIQKGERAGVLIINGVVITTTSREETTRFSKQMGATHVVNHREDLVKQIRELNLPKDIPLKYALITSRTEQYIAPIADILAPFGKVCSIVQAKFDMYGTQFMSKSLTFVWGWIGSGTYHGYENDAEEKHHEWYEELSKLVDEGTIKCHLMERKKLTLQGIKEAHHTIEAGKGIGKIALGVDEEGEGQAFR
ncbi:quinone oxidoreductase [Pestalotiopsis sp. NC0098]|nr:quinone oxidoreductase [Pestalotiopsis sp. NC0098]